jgi:hypothetical protein
MSTPIPKVGSWYQNQEGETLKVVAWDLDDKTIEVQYFDGTVGEYDFESWSELTLRPAEPPEDWSGSLDLPSEDYGVDLDQPAGDNHSNPLDDLDK